MSKKSVKQKVPKVVAEDIKPHHHRRRWSLLVPAFSFLLLIFSIALAIYLRYFAYSVQYEANTTAVNVSDSSGSSSSGSSGVATPEVKTSSNTSLLVVKTGSFVVTVESVSDSVQKITKVAEDLKGSVVSSYVSDSSSNCAYDVAPMSSSKSSSMMYPYYGCYNATITVRVPAASYEAARTSIQKIDENARFDSESTQETDVTTQASDLQTLLTSYQSEQTSLQKLLDTAKSVDDILKIRSELTQVSAQVLSLQQQIRDINKNVQYSQLTVSLAKLAETDSSSPSVNGRFAAAWAAMKQDVSNLGTGLIFVLVYAIIYLPVLLVLCIVYWLIRRAIHRKAKVK